MTAFEKMDFLASFTAKAGKTVLGAKSFFTEQRFLQHT